MLRDLITAMIVIGSVLGYMAFVLYVGNYMFTIFPNNQEFAWLGTFFVGMVCPIIVFTNVFGGGNRRRR